MVDFHSGKKGRHMISFVYSGNTFDQQYFPSGVVFWCQLVSVPLFQVYLDLLHLENKEEPRNLATMRMTIKSWKLISKMHITFNIRKQLLLKRMEYKLFYIWVCYLFYIWEKNWRKFELLNFQFKTELYIINTDIIEWLGYCCLLYRFTYFTTYIDLGICHKLSFPMPDISYMPGYHHKKLWHRL